MVFEPPRQLNRYGEAGKKSAHCVIVKFAGMAFVMEENESLYPVAISCFRAQTQMPEASHFGDLIEQLLLDHD